MEKIEFKNYEDSPTTPINAQSLNAMQDNIEEAIENIDTNLKENYMFLKLGSQLRTYATSGNITGLVLEERVGNTWSLDSEGLKITFNETTKIEISANFFYRHFAEQGTQAIDVYMVKNNEDVGRSSFAAPAVSTFCPFIFSPLKIDVTSGDSIYFKWDGTGTDGYFHHGTNSTYIMIKKVR